MIVVVNAGSSSLKMAAFEEGGDGRLVVSAVAERIGGAQGVITVRRDEETSEHGPAETFAGALDVMLRTMALDRSTVTAIGHRIVHGGTRFRAPIVITEHVVSELNRLVPFDPEHLPQAIDTIAAVREALPGVPNVGAFDTAFHATIPALHATYPIPREDRLAGIRRFGFHGLSCESIVRQLRAHDPDADRARTVIAHLGNGSSVTAVDGGRSIDTSMGFTPTGGLMMATRSGDLDPGVVLALVGRHGLEPCRTLLGKRSGLHAIANGVTDMRDLLAAMADDPDAAFAVEMYCHSAARQIAAMVVSLGGLDRLVFTGGIGEHAAPVRRRIAERLGFLGVVIDVEANDAGHTVVSNSLSRVDIRVLHTDEERAIFHHVRSALALEEENA